MFVIFAGIPGNSFASIFGLGMRNGQSNLGGLDSSVRSAIVYYLDGEKCFRYKIIHFGSVETTQINFRLS